MKQIEFHRKTTHITLKFILLSVSDMQKMDVECKCKASNVRVNEHGDYVVDVGNIESCFFCKCLHEHKIAIWFKNNAIDKCYMEYSVYQEYIKKRFLK